MSWPSSIATTATISDCDSGDKTLTSATVHLTLIREDKFVLKSAIFSSILLRLRGINNLYFELR